MRRSDIEKMASLMGLEVVDASDNLLLTCPYAKWTHKSGRDRTPSMSIRINEYGASQFHCFGCKKQGHDIPNMLYELQHYGFEAQSWDGLHKFVADSEKNLERWDVDYESVTMSRPMVYLHTPPPEDVDVIDEGYFDHRFVWHDKLKPYLRDIRGLSKETAELYDLRYDAKKDRIVIPVRWSTGELVGAIGRYIGPKPDEQDQLHYNYFKFAKSLILFGENLLTNDPVVVCEGPFDAMKVRQAGFNSVAVMGAKFSTEQAAKIAQIGQPVIIFFDNDKTGLDQAERLLDELRKRKIDVQSIAPPEGMDAGDMSVKMIQDYLGPLVPTDVPESVDTPAYLL